MEVSIRSVFFALSTLGCAIVSWPDQSASADNCMTICCIRSRARKLHQAHTSEVYQLCVLSLLTNLHLRARQQIYSSLSLLPKSVSQRLSQFPKYTPVLIPTEKLNATMPAGKDYEVTARGVNEQVSSHPEIPVES